MEDPERTDKLNTISRATAAAFALRLNDEISTIKEGCIIAILLRVGTLTSGGMFIVHIIPVVVRIRANNDDDATTVERPSCRPIMLAAKTSSSCALEKWPLALFGNVHMDMQATGGRIVQTDFQAAPAAAAAALGPRQGALDQDDPRAVKASKAAKDIVIFQRIIRTVSSHGPKNGSA